MKSIKTNLRRMIRGSQFSKDNEASDPEIQIVVSHTSNPPASLPPKASLLGLPAEIRQLIYEYLIPNTPALLPDGLFSTWPTHLRTDESPCGYSALLVNRQIHEEIIDLWYSDCTFRVRLQGDVEVERSTLNFLDRNWDLDALPSVLYKVRRMRLFMYMHHWEGKGEVEGLLDKFVSQLVSNNSRLRHLEIHIEIDARYCRKLFWSSWQENAWNEEECRESMEKGLRYSLGPLMRLGDVEIGWWRMSVSKGVRRSEGLFNERFRTVMGELGRLGEGYMVECYDGKSTFKGVEIG